MMLMERYVYSRNDIAADLPCDHDVDAICVNLEPNDSQPATWNDVGIIATNMSCDSNINVVLYVSRKKK